MPTGTYKAWAFVDGGCVVDEGLTKEANNTASASYTVAKPELYVSKLTAVPTDRSVQYKATVCNQGTSALKTFYVELFYHLTAKPTCSTPYSTRAVLYGLGAGKCGTYTFNRGNVPTGTYKAWAFVDGGCVVDEGLTKEANNTASASYTVAKPELYVSKLTAVPTDRSVQYKATVCNQGTSALATFYVEIFYHLASAPVCGTPYSTRAVLYGLGAGKCGTYTFNRGNVPTGTYKAWAFVDGGCVVDEGAGNELNNVRSASYTVAKPELYVSSLTAVPTDRSVQYKATVCNKGTSALSTFYVELFYHLASAPSCATSYSTRAVLYGLGAGKCGTYTFNRGNVPTGTYTAWAFADGGCVVDEGPGNELNNLRSVKYTVSKPDLYVSSLTATPKDRSVQYKATVCNKGTSALKTFYVELFYNLAGAPSCTTSYSTRAVLYGLGAGKCGTYTFNRGNVPTGDFTAWAFADGGCVVGEADEGNNTASTKYTVKKPDLHVSSFTSTINGATVTYKATVCNKGTSALNTFYLELFYSLTAAPTCSTPYSTRAVLYGLGAGKCGTYTFTRSSAPPGAYTSWAFADGGCAVTEADEGNNTRSSPVGFGADLYVSKLDVQASMFKATYTVTVCNQGDSVTKPFELGLFYNRGNAPSCKAATSQKVSISKLAKGACEVRSFVQATPLAGSYKAWAMVDLGCVVAEVSETNNVKSAAYAVKSDLYIAKLTATPTAGSYKVTYNLTVCNKGANSKTPFSLGLYFHRTGGPGCADKPDINWVVNGLNSGLCASYTHARPSAPAGSYTAWARADTDCKAVELDEANNNLAAKYVVALLPDLHVASFKAAVNANTVSFEVNLCNKGAAVTHPLMLGLYFNRAGAPSCADKPDRSVLLTGGVGAGQCTLHKFTRPAVPPGLYLGWALADSQCKVPETDESNNATSAGYLVVTTLPDAGVVDGAVPDGWTGDGAAPDQALPDQGLPDQAAPDQGLPDQAQPDQSGDDLSLPPDAGADLVTGDASDDSSAVDAGTDGDAGDTPPGDASVEAGDGAEAGAGDKGAPGQDKGGATKEAGLPGVDARSGQDSGADVPGSDDGCTCAVDRRGGAGLSGVLMLLALAVLRRRKR